MTATATKTNRETWRDWMPPDEPEPSTLLTRGELLDRLQSEGIEVNETTLVYWEKIGILPRAVRRWRDGKQAALYPEWIINAIARIALFQRGGADLDHIRVATRLAYRRPTHDHDEGIRAISDAGETMAPLIREWAKLIAQSMGTRVAWFEVRVHMDDGAEFVQSYA